MKNSIVLILIIFLLAACGQKETNSPMVEEKQTAGLPQTDEEWLAFSAESKWSERQNLTNIEFAEPVIVNFEGDLIPEVVIAYSPTKKNLDGSHGYLIGKFNIALEAWDLWQHIQLERKSIQTTEILDKLKFDDRSELLVTKETDAEANAALRMYRYSKKDDQIIEAARTNIDANQKVLIDPSENLLSYYSYETLTELKLEDNNWLAGTDEKIYLNSSSSMFKEEYWDIIGSAPIKEFPITIGDSYEETKRKIGEPLAEDYSEGAFCAYYNTFEICKVYEGADRIVHLTSEVSNEVTIQDFKEVLGEPFGEGTAEYPYEGYSYTYTLGDTYISMRVLSEDPNDNISVISIIEVPK